MASRWHYCQSKLGLCISTTSEDGSKMHAAKRTAGHEGRIGLQPLAQWFRLALVLRGLCCPNLPGKLRARRPHKSIKSCNKWQYVREQSVIPTETRAQRSLLSTEGTLHLGT